MQEKLYTDESDSYIYSQKIIVKAKPFNKFNQKHTEMMLKKYSTGAAAYFFDAVDPIFLSGFMREAQSDFQAFSSVYENFFLGKKPSKKYQKIKSFLNLKNKKKKDFLKFFKHLFLTIIITFIIVIILLFVYKSNIYFYEDPARRFGRCF